MNEILISILMILLFSSITFSFTYILIRKFRINHPRDKFRILTIVMISILFISLFSFSVIGYNLQNQSITTESSLTDNEEKYSLVVVIDELLAGSDDNISSKDTNICNSETELLDTDEKNYSNQSDQMVKFFLIDSKNDLYDLLPKLSSSKFDILYEKLSYALQLNNKSNLSELSNQKENNEGNEKKSNFGLYFFIFHIILLVVCIVYLLFSFIFGKGIILKNIDAKECKDKKVLHLVKKLCRELNIKTPKVFVFKGNPNAFIFGYPVSLVISESLINNLSQNELSIALRHEIAHISNKDYILKPILQTIRIILFYNPIIHILYKKIINERELLADSKFISSKKEKIKFMEVLFKINELSQKKIILSTKIHRLSSFSLVPYKIKKLDLTDRFDNLFSNIKKKSFITAIIGILILLSNIAVIFVAQNNLLNNSTDSINEKLEPKTLDDSQENNFNNELIKTVYILRRIKQDPDSFDLIVVDEPF